MKRIVLYVMSPIHVIGQLTAVRHRHGDAPISADLIIHWPFAPDEVLGELAEVIRKMSSWAEFIQRVVVVPQSLVDRAMSSGEAAEHYRAFRNLVASQETYEEIYFPHDVSGYVYQLLAGAYPEAYRITTGENLGHVFQRDVYFEYLNPSAPPSLRFASLRSWLRPTVSPPPAMPPGKIPDALPHEAILLLPVDQSGAYLENLPLQVPDRALARETAKRCAEACDELLHYIRSLVRHSASERNFVLCTQNFAECGTVDFARDVELWVSAVEKHCPPGSTIYLKGHPAESLPRCDALKVRLASRYAVIELDKRFARYPIELWEELVLNATPMASSMPLLSLKYLYDVDSLQTIDRALIERFFPQNVWAFYENGLSLFTEPLRRYPTWDRRSILWSGSRRTWHGSRQELKYLLKLLLQHGADWFSSRLYGMGPRAKGHPRQGLRK